MIAMMLPCIGRLTFSCMHVLGGHWCLNDELYADWSHFMFCLAVECRHFI